MKKHQKEIFFCPTEWALFCFDLFGSFFICKQEQKRNLRWIGDLSPCFWYVLFSFFVVSLGCPCISGKAWSLKGSHRR